MHHLLNWRRATTLAAITAAAAAALLAPTGASAMSNTTGCYVGAGDKYSSAKWDVYGSPLIQARLLFGAAGMTAGSTVNVAVKSTGGSVQSGWHYDWCQADYTAGPGNGLWFKLRTRINFEVAWPASLDRTGGTLSPSNLYGWTLKRRCWYQDPNTGSWVSVSSLGGISCNVG